jgi:hypothetical protein
MANYTQFIDKNNELVDVDEKDFDAAKASGLEPAFQMRDKEGNETWVRKSHFQAAKKQGLVQEPIWQGQQANKKDINRLEGGAVENNIASAAMGAADTATFGFSDEIAGGIGSLYDAVKKGKIGDLKKDYQRNRDNYRTLADEYGKEYTAANIAGSLAGGLLPGAGVLAAGGKAATGAAKLGKLAATGAAQGGIYGIGGGIDKEQADLTGKNSSLGNILRQGAVGAATGGVLSPLIGGAANKIANSAKTLEDMSFRRAVAAANPFKREVSQLTNKGQYNQNVNEMGKNLLDSGIVKAFDTSSKVGEKAAAQVEASGNKIRDYIASSDKIIADLKKKKPLAAAQLSPDKSKIIGDIRDEIIAPLIEDPAKRKLAKQVIDEVYTIKKYWDKKPPTIGELSKLKSSYQDMIFRNGKMPTPDSITDELRQITGILNKHIENSVENANKLTLGAGAAKSDFLKAKKDFGFATRAKDMVQKDESADLSRKLLGLTDNQWLSHGIGASILGGAAGGAATGGAGLLGTVAAVGAKKLLENYGNSTSAAAMYKLSKMIKKDPQKVKDYFATLGRGVGNLTQEKINQIIDSISVPVPQN